MGYSGEQDKKSLLSFSLVLVVKIGNKQVSREIKHKKAIKDNVEN